MDNSINKILQELGIDGLPIEMQDRILSKFTENLIKQIGLKIFPLIPEADRDAFEKLSSQGDVEAINNFLKEKIPDCEHIITAEVNQAKEDFKKTLQELS